MNRIARKRKIESWASVRDKIVGIVENASEQSTALSLPYGLQKSYTISHPEPVRLLLHPAMNEYDTFLTHHGKAKKYYLNLWTVNHKDSAHTMMIKQQKIQLNYQIKHLIYVPTHRCFVSFATDLSLRVLGTINFTEMSCVFTNHSVLCLYYNACRDDILAGCLGFVMIWKFPHAQNSGLVPIQRVDCPSILPDYWVTWIKVDKRSHQLLLNCEEAIVMLDERTYKLRQVFKINFRHKLPFSACVFYHPSWYFITGSKDYSIKVWKTSLKQCPLVTTFNGHCNAITALEVDNANHLLISSSSDKTIRIWCLETFTQTYCLETGEEVQRMEMMTSQRLFYQSEEHIRVWHLNHFHKLFVQMGFEIVTSRLVKSSDRPTRLMLQGQDGAIRIVSPTDGTVITTMFPLENVPHAIVDYAYSPIDERLYTVLSTGGILVFSSSTNPCSAFQVWKSDTKVCCVAMIEVKSRNGQDYHRLLFSGLRNGHIALTDSKDVTMNETIEAHYGRVAMLRVSENWLQHKHEAPESGYLVSCGVDFTLKLWNVVHRGPKSISLELWCLMTMQTIPNNIAMFGTTVGLIVHENSIMTYRIKSEAVRAGSKRSHRFSVANLEDHQFDVFEAVNEEKHSKPISGFSACPTLDIFATSSYDWSVKIWNHKAKLVKEICFDESLRGVCFANPRGDLLVGFQSHISIVPLTNYLPLNYLELLSDMNFADDVLEDNVPFDRISSFSYDPDVTPCMPFDLTLRQRLEKKTELERAAKIPINIPSAIFAAAADSQHDEGTKPKEGCVMARRYSTSTEQRDLDEKLRRLQKSSLSRRSSAVQSPLFDEVIARITQSFASRSELTAETNLSVTESCTLIDQLRKLFDEDDKPSDKYWPCAPDGFIPNSVVRLKVPPWKIPDHLIPKLLRGDALKEWMENTTKSAGTDISEDSFSPISIDEDIGTFSIFDGYVAPTVSAPDLKQIISGQEEEEDDEVLDEELEMKKQWKASMRTTLDKETMLSTYKTRQQMKERKKVSKKPRMPVIIAAEEEEEEQEDEKAEDVETEMNEEQEMIMSGQSGQKEPRQSASEKYLPPILRGIVDQPWFPKGDVSDMSMDAIYEEIINLMSDCAPLTYHKICSQITDIQSSLGVSNSMKQKTLNLIVDNLGNPSATIRRASLRAVQELNCKTMEAIGGIVSCLNHKSIELSNDAMVALNRLLGINDKEALRDLFITLKILTPVADESEKGGVEILKTKTMEETKLVQMAKVSMVNDWLNFDVNDEEKYDRRAQTTSTGEGSLYNKLRLYKKSPDLTIPDAMYTNIHSPPSELFDKRLAKYYTNNFTIQELKKFDIGYKLLSRIGYTRQSSSGGHDKPVESYQIEEGHETTLDTGVWGVPFRKIGHEIMSVSLGNVPVIQISEVSTMSKRSENQSSEDEHLVLPKILHCLKTFRHHEDGNMIKIPYYKRLPRIRGVSQVSDSTSEQDSDESDDIPLVHLKPGRKLGLREDEEPIEPSRRTSILKDLRERRTLSAQQEEITTRLSEEGHRLSSLRSSSTRSRKITPLSVSYEAGSEGTDHDSFLPRISITPKHQKPTKFSPHRSSITKDILRTPLSRRARSLQQSQFQYQCGDTKDHLFGERLTRVVKVSNKKCERSEEVLRKAGEYKCGLSRYGILEVLWTTMDTLEAEGKDQAPCYHDKNTQPADQQDTQTKRLLGQKEMFPVKPHLKPIRNHNLVTNPYTTNKGKLFKELKRLAKVPPAHLGNQNCSRDFVHGAKNEQQSQATAETLGAEKMWTVVDFLQL